MSEEEEERELENAEAAFQDEDRGEEEEEAAFNEKILTALGFKRYDDEDEINFGMIVLNTKIGVKFNPEHPTGKVWAYVLTEDNKKDFIKNGNLKQLPLVQRYTDIQAGRKPVPERTVKGRIIEKRGRSMTVEIEEDAEKKEINYGLGAVKRHDDGHHFIPFGFSKPSSNNPEGKMSVPRDILLPELDAQTPAPTTIPIKNREEQGRQAQPAAAEPTVPELISKYTEMLALVTEAINAEDRIPEREKGYGIKFVFYSVRGALENGGEEQA